MNAILQQRKISIHKKEKDQGLNSYTILKRVSTDMKFNKGRCQILCLGQPQLWV